MKTPEEIAREVIDKHWSLTGSEPTNRDMAMFRAGMAEAYRDALRRYRDSGTPSISAYAEWLYRKAEECEK